ncbi:hypothetical protein V9J15_01930 [Candidatus Liberibacter africanus]|uniref:DNA polymerase III subunits gamma and tau n=1 Tax=Candidatus Liberibacter africanus PTSAPSY TaxID=1277257 RepID=A0A0G3I6H7_LIBAF|nr:hypothetical protein [Candidatus Liberibacter africanus]AKK20103.1 DNA polymerase III subunits gamma and tau [Candidatus Liberibacter africanus PTSAPSY]
MAKQYRSCASNDCKGRLIALCEKNNDYKMKDMLLDFLHVVSFEPELGRVEVSFIKESPENFIENLVVNLKNWTGKDWEIIFSLGEYCENFEIDANIQSVRAIFPEAQVVCIRTIDHLE